LLFEAIPEDQYFILEGATNAKRLLEPKTKRILASSQGHHQKTITQALVEKIPPSVGSRLWYFAKGYDDETATNFLTLSPMRRNFLAGNWRSAAKKASHRY